MNSPSPPFHGPHAPASSPAAQLLRRRRTVHAFLPEPAPPELLWQAIELARWAPNHKLTEPWRFHLLGPKTREAVIALCSELVAAEKGPAAALAKRARWEQIPGWIVVCWRRDPAEVRDRENYAAVCCAVQNFSLFLWEQGFGVKWSTGPVTRCEQLLPLLGADAREWGVVGLLWHGRPADIPEMTRRSVEEITAVHP